MDSRRPFCFGVGRRGPRARFKPLKGLSRAAERLLWGLPPTAGEDTALDEGRCF